MLHVWPYNYIEVGQLKSCDLVQLEMLSTRLVPLHLNVKYDSQINGTVVTDFKQTWYI